ncbi:GAF domain-containing protein [Modestobacter sp. VKM Ac-2979]|uniref:sensor histidine kinase n=1 Tax=unclassified Modestobacter TaxID=2643866 RepID=UPI0022ABA643|nr:MULTISPECIES: GAF domain-containing protein [unclassified Modestobacter]MCZ2812057.1 GAF domain-containing protein [Modestobacter sp. VKM Ac-2979]MCZ2843781.1 GAF domain-containing protein [Modestobacter sp. VKM Ac-2980]
MAERDDPDVPGPRRDDEPRLSFPDRPRLELDQLLVQLVDRAQEVIGTQGRLRGLLRANQLVTRDLTASTVVHRTVEAARDLLGARSATLEIESPAGTRARPAVRSTGRGCARPDAGMDVPIRVFGDAIGTLHLEDSDRGGFTAEDRELAQALASTAGVAIHNARLYESARRRGEWLQASAAITRELLSGTASGDSALDLVARSCRDVAGADVVAVLRPDQGGHRDRQFRVEVLVGAEGIAVEGRPVPLAGTLLGRVLAGGEPIAVTDDTLDEEPGALPWTGPEVGSVLAVPLRGKDTALGVLCAARLPRRPAFSGTDVEMAAGFANQAAVAIELAEARAEQQRAVVLDERERIATDLQDTVVQRLFSIGLSLQGLLAALPDDRAAERVRATVDDIDRTINHIRGTVFPLGTVAARVDPRDQLLDAIAEAGAVLGFEPDVRFAGLRAGRLAEDLAEDVADVVRVALLDVARRGRARTAAVDVMEDRDGLVVHVRDDDAEGADEAGDVCGELRRRAERLGGTATVSAATPAGTSQYWWVPRR